MKKPPWTIRIGAYASNSVNKINYTSTFPKWKKEDFPKKKVYQTYVKKTFNNNANNFKKNNFEQRNVKKFKNLLTNLIRTLSVATSAKNQDISLEIAQKIL